VAADPYCTGAHPDGWLCILRRGHDGPHLSLDNRARWRGTVGKPVRWRADVVDLPDLDDGPSYGEAVVQAIRDATDGALPLSDHLRPHQTPPTPGEVAALGLAGPCPECGGDHPASVHLDAQAAARHLGLVTSSQVPPGRLQAAPARLPGYTGIPCDACGSLNTVRSGKCLTCMDCHAAGECG
jgi:hypothetical protein